MDGRQFRDEVFGQFARMGAAFGHAKRVEIIDVLAQGERNVESLAEQISATVANTSRHLQILSGAGLVSRRVEGTARVYRLADPSVEAAYRTIVALAEARMAQVSALKEAFFSGVDQARAVSFDELDELSHSGDVVLIDVRPASEYEAGHVEGALSVPLAELEERLSELPHDATIVAYCRGPYCVMDAMAVANLRGAGLDAVRLDGGFPQWRDAGRPVASGSGR